MSACNSDSSAVQSEEAAPVVEAAGKTLAIDVAASKLGWKGGKAIGGAHNGYVAIKNGEMKVENGKLTGGSVLIDMTSITNEDLNKKEDNDKLLKHLKGADFFNVDSFPTAKFEVSTVEPLEGTEGLNATVSGNLTIKGITKQIQFPAMVTASDEGASLKAQFTINRTDWGIQFGSSNFIADLAKDRIINDDIEFTLDIVAK